MIDTVSKDNTPYSQQLCISPTEVKGKWRLSSAFTFWWFEDGEITSTTVPAGYVFDGASIPRIFWTFIGHPLNTRSVYAALLHDYCFSEGIVSFERSAELYRAFLIQSGMPRWKVQVHYLAVRTPFARAIYDGYRKP